MGTCSMNPYRSRPRDGARNPKAQPLAALLAAVCLTGCSVPIKYSVRDVPAVSSSPLGGQVLAVREFEDVREAIHEQTRVRSISVVWRSNKEWYYNNDRRYKDKRTSPWITAMMAKHLEASKVFKSVALEKDIETSPDLVLSGKIKKFEAFKERSTGGETSAHFGLLGVLVRAGSKTPYEATTLLDVTLTRVSSDTVLWQGEIEGKIQGEDSAGPYSEQTVYEKANLSLKHAVQELISRLTDELKLHPDLHE